MEADTTAIRRFGTVATDLAVQARAAATTATDIDIGDASLGTVAARFVHALRAAVAAHAGEVVLLGELLEQASEAAAAAARAYVGSDASAAQLIGT
ncbi:MAG: hypothetical protein ACSLE6_06665 [Mycobacterium sp.]